MTDSKECMPASRKQHKQPMSYKYRYDPNDCSTDSEAEVDVIGLSSDEASPGKNNIKYRSKRLYTECSADGDTRDSVSNENGIEAAKKNGLVGESSPVRKMRKYDDGGCNGDNSSHITDDAKVGQSSSSQKSDIPEESIKCSVNTSSEKCDVIHSSPGMSNERNTNGGTGPGSANIEVSLSELKSGCMVCPVEGCGRQFGRPSRLTVHMRTHTGEVSKCGNLLLKEVSISHTQKTYIIVR